MPYDSSKIEFHDKMDMFMKLAKLKRPGEDEEKVKKLKEGRQKHKQAKEESQTKKDLT